ncbi:MAG: efflux RND transporter permease subunit, partial [Acidobacteriota bacterium]
MHFLRSLIAGGVCNPVLANMLMVGIIAGGALSAGSLVRESYPAFFLDHIEVQIPYPGASPEDVERAVCTPIEEALAGIHGVREISSVAAENVGFVYLAIESRVRSPQPILEEAKNRIGLITGLPQEAEEPIVRETVMRSEVINVAVYGDVNERILKRVAQGVRDDLMATPGISQVSVSGVRDDEIIIDLSEVALQAYDLSFSLVMSAVSRGSLDLPAGTIQTAEEEMTLRVTGQRLTAADYKDLVIIDRPEAMVRLGDIAEVREGFAERTVRGRFNAKPAAVVGVYKTPDEDITRIAEEVGKYVAGRRAVLPATLQMSVWGDNSLDVSNR